MPAVSKVFLVYPPQELYDKLRLEESTLDAFNTFDNIAEWNPPRSLGLAMGTIVLNKENADYVLREIKRFPKKLVGILSQNGTDELFVCQNETAKILRKKLPAATDIDLSTDELTFQEQAQPPPSCDAALAIAERAEALFKIVRDNNAPVDRLPTSQPRRKP